MKLLIVALFIFRNDFAVGKNNMLPSIEYIAIQTVSLSLLPGCSGKRRTESLYLKELSYFF